MFLFYLILFSTASRTDANRNTTSAPVPSIEELFPMPMNDEINDIAAQFRQNPDWERGNLPLPSTEAEETEAQEPVPHEFPTGPGTIKRGHLFETNDMHGYRIDTAGVHPETEHHIFLVRHGNTASLHSPPSVHLLLA